MLNRFIIAIDGLAGSGKSTSAKLVAKELGFIYLDTGAMYRAITYLALRNDIIDDEDSIVKLTEKSSIKLNFTDGKTIIIINNEDVTNEIRSFEVISKVSEVSLISGVRKALVKIQQEIGKNTCIVTEGRDTTTVVFPDADVKIYLTASIEKRAERRQIDFVKQGEKFSLDEVQHNLSKRDFIDSNRDDSPLTKAEDAFEVDTTDITIDEQVKIILNIAKDVMNKKYPEMKVC
jgi:cytidylate kinase